MHFMELKDGLSGFIRAKNEAQFIEACIDSCVDALDELIIVYNDCTDETPEIVERKRKQYPDKIKAYEYNHNILSHNLTKEEFEYAISLPEDSLRLHSTQCNYALSKVTYKYAVKIDPDQIYFAEELKKWRDVCSGDNKITWRLSFVLGWLFMVYISAYRRISVRKSRPCLEMLPQWLVDCFKKSYEDFAKWQLQRNKVAIAISGVNVFYDKKWYIPFDKYNVHPPYNGASDHLIFRVTNRTFFTRLYGHEQPYTVIEVFHQPNRVMFADTPLWFHQHANRIRCWSKVKKVKDEHPELFVPIEKFVNMTYEEVDVKMDPHVNTLFQRTSFALVHKMGVGNVKKYLGLLMLKQLK